MGFMLLLCMYRHCNKCELSNIFIHHLYWCVLIHFSYFLTTIVIRMQLNLLRLVSMNRRINFRQWFLPLWLCYFDGFVFQYCGKNLNFYYEAKRLISHIQSRTKKNAITTIFSLPRTTLSVRKTMDKDSSKARYRA